jgi:prolipoprotein diacylglyceryltransferase
MKNIAYGLLIIAALMLGALIIWGLQYLYTIGINEKTFIMLVFGGIATMGLIGRVFYVASDSFKKDKLRR